MIMDDVSCTTWFSELEMEECEFKNQHQMPNLSIDAIISLESLTDNYPYIYPMNQSLQTGYIDRDLSIQSNRNSSDYPFASTSDHFIKSSKTFNMSFGNHTSSSPQMNNAHQIYDASDLKYSSPVTPAVEERNIINDFSGCVQGVTSHVPVIRNVNQVQDHVLAERKRRDKLNRQFISLSALVPNLKKMDKASVLEGATKRIKQLQTRMKELEKETTVNNQIFNQESVVLTRRSIIYGSSSIDNMPTSSSDDDLTKSLCNGDTFNPEIEVRVSESNVLVRIYSHKNSSVVMKTISEMERLHLIINSSSVIPFSRTYIIITVSAQMSEECVLTAMDVVKSLQSAIKIFL